MFAREVSARLGEGREGRTRHEAISFWPAERFPCASSLTSGLNLSVVNV